LVKTNAIAQSACLLFLFAPALWDYIMTDLSSPAGKVSVIACTKMYATIVIL
jgi:hypothetical protein